LGRAVTKLGSLTLPKITHRSSDSPRQLSKLIQPQGVFVVEPFVSNCRSVGFVYKRPVVEFTGEHCLRCNSGHRTLHPTGAGNPGRERYPRGVLKPFLGT
jgi:hypothetical protein